MGMVQNPGAGGKGQEVSSATIQLLENTAAHLRPSSTARGRSTAHSDGGHSPPFRDQGGYTIWTKKHDTKKCKTKTKTKNTEHK